MKKILLAALSVAALVVLPAVDASAHGPHYGGRSYVSLGFGYGYYWPYRYYYPSSYIGFSVSPALHGHRHASAGRRQETRTKQLYVYPAAGQGEEQLANDRYDCHVWSADQTGYDPSVTTGTRDDADEYSRAFSACMEARDYVVK